jgi:endonuclease/exonuclease/phosphatase family metal-dependent hydrolase
MLVDQFDSGSIQGDEFMSAVQDAVEGTNIRIEEVTRLVAFVDEIAGEAPVILMGDFNALPSSQEIRYLRDAGFVDCWSRSRFAGYTWDEVNNRNIISFQRAEDEVLPPRRDRIDYVFVRGNGIMPRSARLILNEPTFGIHPSDHFGVYAEIEIGE